MLLPLDLKQLGIYSKIVRSGNGFVRVHFAVLEVGGRLRGRVLSVEPVFSLHARKNVKTPISSVKKILLANPKSAKKISTDVQWYEQAVISPFSNLSFFISQLTRAPAN